MAGLQYLFNSVMAHYRRSTRQHVMFLLKALTGLRKPVGLYITLVPKWPHLSLKQTKKKWINMLDFICFVLWRMGHKIRSSRLYSTIYLVINTVKFLIIQLKNPSMKKKNTACSCILECAYLQYVNNELCSESKCLRFNTQTTSFCVCITSHFISKALKYLLFFTSFTFMNNFDAFFFFFLPFTWL